MSNDARISTALPAHPKMKKLIRRVGQSAAWNLVSLFLWAASNRSDGDLSGLSNEDIELAVDWLGVEGQFVEAMVAVGFLDGAEGAYVIHDWAEHNPWAAGSEMRSAKAKWNALVKHHGKEKAALLMPEYYAQHATSIKPADTDASGSMSPAETSTAPSLTPSLTPFPKYIGDPQADAQPQKSKRSELITVKTMLAEMPEITEQLAIDYQAVRKAKKAPLSRTAWDSIKEQILITQQRYGIPPPQSLTIAIQRGWQGFDADWVAKHLGVIGNEIGQRTTEKFTIDHNDTSWADSLEIPIRSGG